MNGSPCLQHTTHTIYVRNTSICLYDMFFINKILHINRFFTLHLCSMMGIIFDQFFESLKVRFTMYFLHAKNCKVINF
jgi:hypothetical protein